jgi:hypothetical protein
MTVDTETARMSCAHQLWNLPDSGITPEAYYLRGREFLRVFGLGLAASALLPPMIRAESSVRAVFPTHEMDAMLSKEICATLSITDSVALRECLEMNWFDTPAGGTV